MTRWWSFPHCLVHNDSCKVSNPPLCETPPIPLGIPQPFRPLDNVYLPSLSLPCPPATSTLQQPCQRTLFLPLRPPSQHQMNVRCHEHSVSALLALEPPFTMLNKHLASHTSHSHSLGPPHPQSLPSWLPNMHLP